MPNLSDQKALAATQGFQWVWVPGDGGRLPGGSVFAWRRQG